MRFVIDWKREAGRKVAALVFTLRAVIFVFPVSPPDEKLLPVSASSACGSYSCGGKHAVFRVEINKNIANIMHKY